MSKTRTELPAAFYAAAGAGDLAYRKLRTLPEATRRTWHTASETAGTWRRRFGNGDHGLSAELAQARIQVRESARRSAEVLTARAAVAQEKAVTGYRSLVARGERVVGDRFGVATGQSEPPTRVEAVVGEPDEPVAPAVTDTPAAATKPEPGADEVPGTTPKRAGAGGTAGERTRGAAKAGSKAAGTGPAA